MYNEKTKKNANKDTQYHYMEMLPQCVQVKLKTLIGILSPEFQSRKTLKYLVIKILISYYLLQSIYPFHFLD